MECQGPSVFRQKLGRFICGNIFIGSLEFILEERILAEIIGFSPLY